MKNSLLLAVLIFSVTLWGCRTTKVVASEKEDLKVDSNVAEVRESSAKGAVKDSISKLDTSVVDEEITRTTTIIKFSQPDSLGRQFPMEQTVSQEKMNRKAKANITEKRQRLAEVASSDNSSKCSRADVSKQVSSSSKTKTKPPATFAWIAVIVSLGLIVLAYFILRRLRLVK